MKLQDEMFVLQQTATSRCSSSTRLQGGRGGPLGPESELDQEPETLTHEEPDLRKPEPDQFLLNHSPASDFETRNRSDSGPAGTTELKLQLKNTVF